ncbi:placenta-specific gene 8 protein-like [Pimephales promelas]|uniref:placenta-specific gene 8 protein-like n=1 Tax=Pimephales promelas TaxID=90988 RepID=UPI001955F084|nr:placenta-specific gene 8 protein-like [Pimephales promelas]
MAAVIMQQPYIYTPNNAWSSGICDCCQDINSCCCAFWCFSCFMRITSRKFGDSSYGISCCAWPASLGMRVAVRYKYNIGGSICEDIMVTHFCMWCSWCQMSREIKARKQGLKIIQTVPAFQPVPVSAQTRVVPKQQTASVAPAAQAIQMQPIQIG